MHVHLAQYHRYENVCSFCRAKKTVELPDYHFIDHRIEILKHDKDYTNVELYDKAIARNSELPKAK